MRTKIYIYFVLIFAVIGVFALNFNFIEGDDASTVLYHLLGRNPDIQSPYSSYHSMFDTILSIINPNNEQTLRYVSIGVSFLFGFLSLMSLAHLAFLKSKQKVQTIFVVLALLPFLIPEILFGSLIVNPTLISVTFILVSHILFLKYIKTKKVTFLIITIVLFGLGASFRWNNGFYLFILFGDFILTDSVSLKNMIDLKRLKRSFVIFPFFILAVILSIQLSGFSILDIINTYTQSTDYLEGQQTSYTALFSVAITFLTPAFLLLLVLGIYFCFKKKSYRNLVLLLIALTPYLVLGLYPSYKYMICIVIILVLICIQGASLVESKLAKTCLGLVVFLPWLLGVQIQVDSAWGPGFEIKKKENINTNISMDDVKLVLGPGLAMPTPEGPRPMFGFGSVLLKGWNDFISENNLERELATRYAIDNNCDMLQDVRHSLIGTKLVEFGYTSKESFRRNDINIYERKFMSSNDTISINVYWSKKDLFNQDRIKDIRSRKNKFVVYSSYTSTITKLTDIYRDKFEQKGAYWGILKAE